MQFIDLLTQKERIKGALLRRFEDILDRGQFIMGPEVTELEAQLAAYAGTRHCVSCSSGTDALLMPLLAKGIGVGDAVITTPFTFVATAEVINLAGATPIFVDVLPDTFNINPELIGEAVAEAKQKGLQPKAIIPVDLFGLLADYERLNAVANEHHLWILEDACQSFGGSFNGGKAGSFGLVGATSFFPAKPLGGDRIGINGRLDSLHAAVLLEKLPLFDEELATRQRIAEAHNERLDERLVVPTIPEGYRSAWAQYSVLAATAEERDMLMQALQQEGIPSMIYYKIPLHLQKAYRSLGYNTSDFPVSEDLSRRIFSLPMHPYLKDEEIEQICTVLLQTK